MIRRGLVLVLCCAAVVACTGEDQTSTTATATVDTAAPDVTGSVPAPDATDEPELVVGALLPVTGPGAEIGSSMRDGVRLAIDEVNAAGGVRGLPVEGVEADEGSDATTTAGALEELLAEGVDVVVGPASSLSTATVLPLITRAGVLTCSPTASAMSLDGYPDDDLFVRTIPSDSLQATAIADYVIRTGQRSAAVLYLDDAYGRPFAEKVAAELEERSLRTTSFVPYDPTDDDYSGEVRVAIASAPEVVVVIGDGSAGPRMVSALFDQAADDTSVVVNDAMRVPAAASAYQRLPEAALRRMSGVSPVSRIIDGDMAAEFQLRYPDSRGLFAANAYDCVSAIALAANASPDVPVAQLADRLEDVTNLGGPCITYTVCATGLAAGRNIDYDGLIGELHIGADGDVVRGVFDVFRFDGSGRDVDAGEPVIVVGG
jgi:branched-chain amino acid transport system substrate-binding protein